MASNHRLSARQADVLTHYTTTTYFKNDVFRTVMRTSVFIPGWYLSCSNLRCFSAESAFPYAHPSSLDDLTSFISNNSVPGGRIELPFYG